MITCTLDWNCVISVEKKEPQGRFVEHLVELHRRGTIDVALTTVSASENLGGSQEFPASAFQFKERVSALEWDDLTLLLGPAVIGLTYWDMCKIVGDEFVSQRNQLWEVLFPCISRELPPDIDDDLLQSKEYKKWRNAWCDVHTVWTHIDSGRDAFVTLNTKDFQKHSEALERLGLRRIVTPEELANEYPA